jgi:hypothetical protein
MFWPVGTNKHGPSHEQFQVVVPWHTKAAAIQSVSNFNWYTIQGNSVATAATNPW